VKKQNEEFNTSYIFGSDIGKWNVSSVKTISEPFNTCSIFDTNLDKWDVSNVKSAPKSLLLASEYYLRAKEIGRDVTEEDFKQAIKMFELQDELNT